MVEMTLASIRVQLPDNTPVVLLQEKGESRRTLPILIGHQEATAIAYALQGVETQRPLTHDLMRDLLVNLGVRVEGIVVTELRDGIFYAEIRMTRDGQAYTVSSRPSDAMALAVRLDRPIFVEESLLDAEGYVLQDENPDQEDIINQFSRFVEDLRPEDFAS